MSLAHRKSMNASHLLPVVVEPFGDSAVMVTVPSDDARSRRTGITEFRDRLLQKRPYGVTDVVSGLESLLIEFDPLETSPGHLEYAAQLLAQLPADAQEERETRHFDIPVIFDEDAGPDLAAVAEEVGIRIAEVIEGICASSFTIALLAAAMAPMMDGLALPQPVRRCSEPRTDVPAGSIMIAGTNAIIQPFPGPSGWRVVGRTPHTIVDITRAEPVSFAPGDTVRFNPVSRDDATALDGALLLPTGAGR